VGGGTLTEIAESELGFEHSLAESAKRELWVAEQQLAAFAERGMKQNDLQCIGFKTPVVFAESRSVPDNAYVADLYEQVAFLGDLHRQIADVPNGGKSGSKSASRRQSRSWRNILIALKMPEQGVLSEMACVC
jgi:hypothetical protein